MTKTTNEQQRALFETFGFLHLRGALADDIGWITDEFESVFASTGVPHDGVNRSCIVGFIDASPSLCTILDHPVIESVLAVLLGPCANYLGSDGNFYAGDTGWHADGQHIVGTYLKMALYLDKVGRESGALRVVPGSHHLGPEPNMARQAARSQELWGVAGSSVPSVSLDSSPGDVLVFNHNIMHSAWGGGSSRRMFTMNFGSHCETIEEHEELQAYIAVHLGQHGLPQMSSEIMRRHAPPARLLHLQQPAGYDQILAMMSAQRAAAECS